MKKILYIVLCVLPALSYSQKDHAPQPARPKPMDVSRIDTIITKDPINPAREYWVIHNLKGIVRARGFMVNGKKDGVWREYAESNGVLSSLTEYNNGVQHGAVVSFGISGNIQMDETMLNDKKSGEKISYSNYGGKIKTIESFKDDVLDGSKKSFYDDGKIQEDGSYKNGQRNGIVKWYKQNGARTMEYTYENGTLEGPAKVYDEDGKLKQEGVYKNNNEEGEWKEYKDSLLIKRIIYKQGQIQKEIPVRK